MDRHLALVVSYVGTRFAGFQRQSSARTVQAALEEALSGFGAGAAVTVRGAGRTDAGVHAMGQVVDFHWHQGPRIPTAKLPQALVRSLPEDVAVATAVEVAEGFHARFSAVSKRYRYLFWRATVESPFWRPYTWHYTGQLNVAAMCTAADRLIGRHDFRCFAGAGRPVADATRTVSHCSVWEHGPLLGIDVEADGFLYRMVRTIAGTLVEVGRGALDPDVTTILEARDRNAAGPSLPPQGLCLLWVRYPPEFGGLQPQASPFLDAGCSPQ